MRTFIIDSFHPCIMCIKRSVTGSLSFFRVIPALTFLLFTTCTRDPGSPDDSAAQQAVTDDKSALEISFGSGDSASSVTRDIVLPDSGTHGSNVIWATSDSSLISIHGEVHCPDSGNGDAEVTLTATISMETASDTKVFTLRVKESTNTMTDVDGNVYRTVKIGDQVWTAENLRTTRYNDGTPVAFDTSSQTWGKDTIGKYCYYGNTTNTDTIKKFGALYNWHAVHTKKLAPPGWHVPDTTEWNTLESYMISAGFNYDSTTTGNKIARALASQTDWSFYSILGTVGRDLTKNNSSGFTAIPSGSRYTNNFEENAGFDTYWWTTDQFDSSDAHYRYLFGNSIGLLKNHDFKVCGFSVRFLKD